MPETNGTAAIPAEINHGLNGVNQMAKKVRDRSRSRSSRRDRSRSRSRRHASSRETSPEPVVTATVSAKAVEPESPSSAENCAESAKLTNDVVSQYCTENQLDSSAELAFREQTPEIQERIVDEGPCTGTNKSAVLMSRIRRHAREASGGGGSIGGITQGNQQVQTVKEFIDINELDESAVKALEEVSEEVQRKVIDEGIVTGRNKSAILIGRIRRCVAGGVPTQPISRHSGMPNQPTSAELATDMERFIRDNQLDDYAEQALRDQKPGVLATVLAEGPITGESKSKILMGRIRRAQQLSRSGPGSTNSSGNFGMQGGMMPYGMPNVDLFIADNQLDHLASREFLALTPQQQMVVISEGNITGSNKSAVMMGRIRRAQQGQGGGATNMPMTMGIPGDASMQQMQMVPMYGYSMMPGQMPPAMMPGYAMDPNAMAMMNYQAMMGMGAYGQVPGMPMMMQSPQMQPMMMYGYPTGMGGMPGGMGMAPGQMGMQCMPGGASGSMSRVDIFCQENGLDPSAQKTLREQPLDTQERVVSEGFLTGNNKSAVLMSRIRRIASGGAPPAEVTAAVAARASQGMGSAGGGFGGGGYEDNIARFARENNIDSGAEKVLREQRSAVQQLVLDEGNISGGNRSAILISRIRRIERTL